MTTTKYVILHNTTGEYVRGRPYKRKLNAGHKSLWFLSFWTITWDYQGGNPTKIVFFEEFDAAFKWLLLQSSIPSIKDKVVLVSTKNLMTIPLHKYLFKKTWIGINNPLYQAKLSEFEVVTREFTDEELAEY